MSGHFIAVVGPSGVGKDSVMAAMVAADPRIRPARRVITRSPDAGGEVFDGVTPEQFARLQSEGAFALSWSAHGLSYGIPVTVEADLRAGRCVIANLSRGVLERARDRFGRIDVLSLSASRDVLQSRLERRGRETGAQIEGRLERRTALPPEGITVHTLDNSGALEQTVQRALAMLFQARVQP